MLSPASRIIRHASSLVVVAMTYLQLAQREYSRSPYSGVNPAAGGRDGPPQSLKYIFGAQELFKISGPYCKLKGGPLNLLVPSTAVWGLGTLASSF